MPFDTACWELAQAYAKEARVRVTEDEVNALAQAIQDVIEDWLHEVEDASASEGVRDED
jgi:hypothetical protein